MLLKALEPGLHYWFVAVVHVAEDTKIPFMGSVWRGDRFVSNPWEAIYYDTKEEAEGGMILAVAAFPDLMGRVEALPYTSSVRTLRGPDRQHLRRGS